jgi:adenylate cyclase, class 2
MSQLELEIKILDVDKSAIEDKLIKLGARYGGNKLQQILTYDFYPIASSFHGILWTINRPIPEKVKQLSIQKLKMLFLDLDDLLTPEDQKELLALTEHESLSLFSKSMNALDGSLIQLLNDPRFMQVIEKYQTNPNKWVRLRKDDEGTTLAVKQIFKRRVRNGIREHSLADVKEIELGIEDFSKAKDLLQELGFFHKNYQEKKRTSYTLHNEIKIEIDEWPLIPPYLEIEGPESESIYQTVDQLGYKKDDVKIMNADDVFSFYGLNMYSYKELRF